MIYPPGHPDAVPPGTLQTDLILRVILMGRSKQYNGGKIDMALWTTARFARGTSPDNRQMRMFTTPLGCVGQGFDRALTVSETNLREPCITGSNFDVQQVRWEVSGADRWKFYRSATLCWDLVTMRFGDVPLSTYSPPDSNPIEQGDVLVGRITYQDTVVALPERSSFAILIQIGAW